MRKTMTSRVSWRSWPAAFFVAVLALGALRAPQVLGEPPCFRDALIAFQKGQARPHDVRDSLLLGLQGDARAPAFLKQTQGGEIPVILMNNETFESRPEVKALLEASIGTQIALQPNYNNDHGLMRDGLAIIDADTPGARGYGELHGTGLAWKNLASYLPRRRTGASVILEVAYALTPEEKADADYYQRARRAAVFRVPFTFGGARVDATQPNLLQSGGENCFVFCKGSALQAHIDESARRLREMGAGDAGDLMRRPEVREYLARAREALLSGDPYSSGFARKLVLTRPLLGLLKPVFPEAMGKDERAIAACWLIAFDASLRYQELLNTLGVTSNIDVQDMNSPRATAVLVYDAPGSADAFRGGTYETPGKFYRWTRQGQRPFAH